jgi:predicted ArsR family transcriptional regulator
MTPQESDVEALAALAEPIRRRLLAAVAESPHGLSRDEAASALGVARSVAAFHLDKLADIGVLDVEFRRPPGRSGPGAGRPAKIYRRAPRELSFSVPSRRYDVAAVVLADAADRASSTGAPIRDEIASVAREFGRSFGSLQEAGIDPPEIDEALEQLGYEPEVEGRSVTLRNCPFHALAERHRDLVCAMNLELIDGLLEGLGSSGASAQLQPEAGRCCVRIVEEAPRRPSDG